MMRITTEAVCDGCGAVLYGYRGEKPDTLAARATAKRHGWRSIRRVDQRADYCPKCQPTYLPSRCRTRQESVEEFLERFGKATPPVRSSDEQMAVEIAELAALDEYTERVAAGIGVQADTPLV